MSTLEKIAHILVPRHTNNHKAKILHTSSLFVITGFLILYQLGLQMLPQKNVKILGYASNISPDVVVSLTNQKRADNGLPTLSTNSTLVSAARAKAQDMLNKDYWAHVSPDGTEPWSFFISAGYRYRYAGENLARDFADPNSAVEAWMASPSHRDNILNPKYREIGIAVVEGDLAGVDSTIIVQFFGTRLNEPGEIQIAQAQTAAATPTPTTKPIPSLSPTNVPDQSVPLTVDEISPSPASLDNEKLIPAPATVVQENKPDTLFSPFNVTRTMSLVTIIVLGGIMVVDAWIVYKKRITRLSGRNFAHLAFLGVILSIVLLVSAGRIL